MEPISQEELAQWCGNYNNCYYYLFDGQLYNTGPCPFACDEIEEDIRTGLDFKEITEMAADLHPQLAWEVSHNSVRLFSVKTRRGHNLVVECFKYR